MTDFNALGQASVLRSTLLSLLDGHNLNADDRLIVKSSVDLLNRVREWLESFDDHLGSSMNCDDESEAIERYRAIGALAAALHEMEPKSPAEALAKLAAVSSYASLSFEHSMEVSTSLQIAIRQTFELAPHGLIEVLSSPGQSSADQSKRRWLGKLGGSWRQRSVAAHS